MRKKLLSSLLVTAMAVTMLAGCGSNGGCLLYTSDAADE